MEGSGETAVVMEPLNESGLIARQMSAFGGEANDHLPPVADLRKVRF